MKKLLILCVLFFSLGLHAQNFDYDNSDQNTIVVDYDVGDFDYSLPTIVDIENNEIYYLQGQHYVSKETLLSGQSNYYLVLKESDPDYTANLFEYNDRTALKDPGWQSTHTYDKPLQLVIYSTSGGVSF